ncbi:hypothetical protein EB1_29950 [Empedobacter brevis NBRC 14943 = ATCC 43319]|uniref:DUF6896 domain-containing protein n=1 Tax=Empedobacter brevis NBRC 14943 = ATCC 43319 TaxID=1218108 RepID=A0A511NK72_9FLAO|nr:hypothetical protein [Empedobacter brevis]GEM53205.1 hypothetical protein EB1_29950 [Empedobacter brevis NBRC 14943 = ATCC 43319]
MIDIPLYLRTYRSFIVLFEEALKKHYDINDNLYEDYIGVLFDREGSIDNFNYRFHGGGCEVIQNNIVCDYDFIPYDEVLKYQYTIWNLYTFIDTYFNIQIDESDLKKEIEALVEIGQIKKLVIDNKVYDTYFL